MGKAGPNLISMTAGALNSITRYLIFMVFLSATASVLGYMRSAGDFGNIGVMIKGVEDLAVSLRSMPLLEQWLSVFIHNMRVVIIVIGMSWFPIIPVMTVALMNSIMLGAMLKATAEATGIAPITVLVGLMPHGIFELAAFFIGAAISLRIGMLLPLWVTKAVDGSKIKKAGYDALLLFFTVIVPLMLVASFIEVTFSAWLAEVLAR
jgi:stage II sporulation protein M